MSGRAEELLERAIDELERQQKTVDFFFAQTSDAEFDDVPMIVGDDVEELYGVAQEAKTEIQETLDEIEEAPTDEH